MAFAVEGTFLHFFLLFSSPSLDVTVRGPQSLEMIHDMGEIIIIKTATSEGALLVDRDYFILQGDMIGPN